MVERSATGTNNQNDQYEHPGGMNQREEHNLEKTTCLIDRSATWRSYDDCKMKGVKPRPMVSDRVLKNHYQATSSMINSY